MVFLEGGKNKMWIRYLSVFDLFYSCLGRDNSLAARPNQITAQPHARLQVYDRCGLC
jgi:hypothetical protein